MILNQLNGRRVCAGPVRPLSFWVLFAVFVAFAALHWTVRAAGVSVPDGAPPWALSAKNLEYHPVDGVSLIAYVNPSTGNDSTGDVYTFAAANGDFRKKPAAIDPFLTTDAAIAAVGREGPHAVLLAAGLTHTSPITSGGCEGASAAHPFLIGAYWPSGTIPATAAGQMAILDPGLENAAAAITKTLVEDAWLADAGGAFKLAVGPGLDIDSVTLGDVTTYLVPGEYGTLSQGQWAYDTDTGQLQVRLAADANPTGTPVYRRSTLEQAKIVNIQRGDGFSNLIVENLSIRQAHKIASDPAYAVAAAQDPVNNWRALRVYGGNQENILLRNIKVEGAGEGIACEATGYDPANQLRYVTFDHVIVHNTWGRGTLGLYTYGLYRPRLFSCVIIGNGFNYLNPSLDDGDTAQGRTHNFYCNFTEAPWVHSSIIGLGCNAGLQLRCGGYVTQTLCWANADNLAWGHGQNAHGLAGQLWTYTCKGRDIVVWGTKPVGGTIQNGLGIGWGECDDLDLQRFIVIGEDTYRAEGGTNALSLGVVTTTVPTRTTSIRIAAGAVFDWCTSTADTTSSFEFQSGAATPLPVSIVGLRFYERCGNIWRASGTESVTRARVQAATMSANRYEMTGTATIYGPSGTTPSKITGGGRNEYAVRPGLTAMPPLHTFLGFSSETAMIAAFNTPYAWDGARVVDRVFPLWRFNPLPSKNPSAPNVPATGLGS